MSPLPSTRSVAWSMNLYVWRWKNVKRKNDKDDALKLARLSMMIQLKPVHVPKRDVREHSRLVKYRKTLSERVNRVKNSIRSLFANRGIEIDRGKKAWCTGRELINSFHQPIAQCEMSEMWRRQPDVELGHLDSLTEQLKQIEQRLEEIAKADDRIVRITRRGSALVRTMLRECAWVSLRYNQWCRTTYDRIHGGQKTRKENAAIALRRALQPGRV